MIQSLKKQDPFDIMDDAIDNHGIKTFYCLYSGGKDSSYATHFAWNNYRKYVKGVIFTITGVGARAARYHAIRVAKEQGWPLIFTWPRNNHRFIDIIRREGFPGPGNHKKMMGYLKAHSWETFLSQRREEAPALISGVRHRESKQRETVKQYSQQPIDWHRKNCFIKPIFHMMGRDVWDYIGKYNLPISPVHEWLNISGDCFCGSYAEMWELKMIQKYDPDAYNHIKWCESQIQIRIKELNQEIVNLGRGVGSRMSLIFNPKAKNELRQLIKTRNKLISYPTWGSGPKTSDVENQTLMEDYCGESCVVEDPTS